MMDSSRSVGHISSTVIDALRMDMGNNNYHDVAETHETQQSLWIRLGIWFRKGITSR